MAPVLNAGFVGLPSSHLRPSAAGRLYARGLVLFVSVSAATSFSRIASPALAARRNVWSQPPESFFDEAVINVDGVIVGTTCFNIHANR